MEPLFGQPDVQNIPATILPLSADVIAQVKSAATITNLNGVILGLFENSLDAEATRIDISVNYRRGDCIVEDNGVGVLPSEFREGGGLGRMYHTSKQKNRTPREVHGGHGTFLASVGSLSLLTITSRQFQHFSHNTLVIHRAKVISRLTPTLPQHEIRNSAAQGTRVSVRDLFGNMPVRVKQRALSADEASENEKQWQVLKLGIVGLLLPRNHRVNVRIVDMDDPTRTFSINTTAHFAPTALSERNINSLNKTAISFDQNTVLSTLTQAGFISADSKDSWIPASASTLSVAVRGLISLEPTPNKLVQFISVGITPCMNENRHNELYDTVNRIFAQSSFGHIDNDSEPDEAELERRQHDRRYKKDGPTNKQLRSASKGVDRWPKFYFHIELNNKADVQPLSRISDMLLKSIINVLKSLVTHWLEANGFRPKQLRHKRKHVDKLATRRSGLKSTIAAAASPLYSDNKSSTESELGSAAGISTRNRHEDRPGQSHKRTRLGTSPQAIMTAMPFTDWSRIKSARPQLYEDIWRCKTSQKRESAMDPRADTLVEQCPTPHAAINVEGVFAGQFGDGGDVSARNANKQPPRSEQTGQVLDTDEDKTIEWIDPETNQRHRVNQRTGVIVPHMPQRSTSKGSAINRPVAAANSQVSSFGKPLVLKHRQEPPGATPAPASPWLQDFLQSWENPVFPNQSEQDILKIGSCELGPETCSPNNPDKRSVVSIAFSFAGRADSSRISKAALAHARIISQVDQKFILMRIPNISRSSQQALDHNRSLLVLMDQHAASERCILEKLLQELCTPNASISAIKSNLGHTSTIMTVSMDKPLRFEIPRQEENLFRAHAAHFASWGILYNLQPGDPSPPRLDILTLPPGISERCKSEPKLVIDLLRGEVHNLSEAPGSSGRARTSTSSTADEKHPWLRKLGSCPPGLLNLLNSRACRSAIMFNDKLDIEECQSLVDELADCAFPFMCAHGRNSMVPLVYLDGDQALDSGHLNGFGGKSDQGESFASAYKKWRKKAA